MAIHQVVARTAVLQARSVAFLKAAVWAERPAIHIAIVGSVLAVRIAARRLAFRCNRGATRADESDGQ